MVGDQSHAVNTPGLPDEPVLSTLNRDGTRRWLRPKVSKGRFLERRRGVGYALIVLFAALPYIRIGGKPAVLLDLPNRQFTFFGTTFLPTDTLLLAFLLLSIFIGIFLLTALFGRVWCGWGCPQTVYMEYVYRPLERLFDGRNYTSGGKADVHPARRVAKYLVFLVVSFVIAHIFLAYFVGVDELFRWVRLSPLEHPMAFAIVGFTTFLMMLDFCLFREQVCTLMCPYGRLQSVLLDRQSLIVSYDTGRGEPRGKLRKKEPRDDRGDCIDCNLCVVTCPTGIDIRDGLQMECIGCAQCIDACDEVMDRIKRPRGLIRYSSQQSMEEGRRKLLRPRVVVYPLLLGAALTLFGFTLAGKDSADVSFLRNRARPYQLVEGGGVANTLTVKIANRTDEVRTYDVTVAEAAGTVSSELPLAVAGLSTGQATVHVTLPRQAFDQGRATITVRVTDDDGFEKAFEQTVLGPLFAGTTGEEDP
jgi:cytochrome c oxidase accessory protein FixG